MHRKRVVQRCLCSLFLPPKIFMHEVLLSQKLWQYFARLTRVMMKICEIKMLKEKERERERKLRE